MAIGNFSNLVTNPQMKKVLSDVAHIDSSKMGKNYQITHKSHSVCTSGPATWYRRAGLHLTFWNGAQPYTSTHKNYKKGVRSATVADMKASLSKAGFQIVWSGTGQQANSQLQSSGILRPGDVATMLSSNSAHAAMWTGQDWRSDFLQGNKPYPYSSVGRGGNETFIVWRHPNFQSDNVMQTAQQPVTKQNTSAVSTNQQPSKPTQVTIKWRSYKPKVKNRWGIPEDRSYTNDNALAMINFLISKGLPKIAAIGIAGSMMGEVSFNPYKSGHDINGPSGGIAQWHDGPSSNNFTRLKRYAKSKGKPWTDIETQANFLWSDISKSLLNKLKAAKTVEEAAFIWGNQYERFRGYRNRNSKPHRQRAKYARQLSTLYDKTFGTSNQIEVLSANEPENVQEVNEPQLAKVESTQSNNTITTPEPIPTNNVVSDNQENNYYSDYAYNDNYTINNNTNNKFTIQDPIQTGPVDYRKAFYNYLNSLQTYQSGGSIFNNVKQGEYSVFNIKSSNPVPILIKPIDYLSIIEKYFKNVKLNNISGALDNVYDPIDKKQNGGIIEKYQGGRKFSLGHPEDSNYEDDIYYIPPKNEKNKKQNKQQKETQQQPQATSSADYEDDVYYNAPKTKTNTKPSTSTNTSTNTKSKVRTNWDDDVYINNDSELYREPRVTTKKQQSSAPIQDYDDVYYKETQSTNKQNTQVRPTTNTQVKTSDNTTRITQKPKEKPSVVQETLNDAREQSKFKHIPLNCDDVDTILGTNLSNIQLKDGHIDINSLSQDEINILDNFSQYLMQNNDGQQYFDNSLLQLIQDYTNNVSEHPKTFFQYFQNNKDQYPILNDAYQSQFNNYSPADAILVVEGILKNKDKFALIGNDQEIATELQNFRNNYNQSLSTNQPEEDEYIEAEGNDDLVEYDPDNTQEEKVATTNLISDFSKSSTGESLPKVNLQPVSTDGIKINQTSTDESTTNIQSNNQITPSNISNTGTLQISNPNITPGQVDTSNLPNLPNAQQTHYVDDIKNLVNWAKDIVARYDNEQQKEQQEEQYQNNSPSIYVNGKPTANISDRDARYIAGDNQQRQQFNTEPVTSNQNEERPRYYDYDVSKVKRMPGVKKSNEVVVDASELQYPLDQTNQKTAPTVNQNTVTDNNQFEVKSPDVNTEPAQQPLEQVEPTSVNYTIPENYGNYNMINVQNSPQYDNHNQYPVLSLKPGQMAVYPTQTVDTMYESGLSNPEVLENLKNNNLDAIDVYDRYVLNKLYDIYKDNRIHPRQFSPDLYQMLKAYGNIVGNVQNDSFYNAYLRIPQDYYYGTEKYLKTLIDEYREDLIDEGYDPVAASLFISDLPYKKDEFMEFLDSHPMESGQRQAVKELFSTLVDKYQGAYSTQPISYQSTNKDYAGFVSNIGEVLTLNKDLENIKPEERNSTITKRWSYYKPIIDKAFEGRNLPEIFKYIPFVSDLNPKYKDTDGKRGLDPGRTGIWQLSITPARGIGLEVNTLVDQRQDPIVSSQKAVDYLSDLYRIYKDEMLTITAFLYGSQILEKAIVRAYKDTGINKPVYSIIKKYLPKKSMMQTLDKIKETYDQQKYRQVDRLDSYPTGETVTVNSRLNLEQIANILNIPINELRLYNPQFREDIVPGQVKQYTINLPVGYGIQYSNNLNDILNQKYYESRDEVQPGDRAPNDYNHRNINHSKVKQNSNSTSNRNRRNTQTRQTRRR